VTKTQHLAVGCILGAALATSACWWGWKKPDTPESLEDLTNEVIQELNDSIINDDGFEELGGRTNTTPPYETETRAAQFMELFEKLDEDIHLKVEHVMQLQLAVRELTEQAELLEGKTNGVATVSPLPFDHIEHLRDKQDLLYRLGNLEIELMVEAEKLQERTTAEHGF